MKIFPISRGKIPLLLMALGVLGGCASQSGLGDKPPAKVYLPEGPSAVDYLEQALKDHHLVFLSENHADVAPIIFLTENLERLHRTGLRILFVEGQLPVLEGTSGYFFPMFPPWMNAGWKYEHQQLAQQLEALNARLPAEEKIRVVEAEEGVPNPASHDPETLAAHMNLRDSTAAGRIREEMDRLPKEYRGLIFYGASHGYRFPQPAIQAYEYPERKLEPWISLGSRLWDHYGVEFHSLSSHNLEMFFHPSEQEDWQDLSGDGTRGLSFSSYESYIRTRPLYGQSYGEYFRGYHGVLLLPREVYGRMYQYVPTRGNLEFIRGLVKGFSRRMEALQADQSGFRSRAKGQVTLGIYTLRLWYGEKFEYDLWNPGQPLSTALEKLEVLQAAGPGIEVPSDAVLQSFHRHMRLSRLEPWLATGDRGLLTPLLEHLPRAVAVFPQDAWARYWLALVLSESGRPLEALPQWEALLAMPLSRSLETYPEALAAAAKCAEKVGRPELSRKWQKMMENLATEGLLSFNELQDTHGRK